MKKAFLSFTGFLLVTVCSFAQTHTLDSLQNLFKNETQPGRQRELVLKICSQYYSMSTDDLLKYVNAGRKLFPPATPDYFRIENFYGTWLSKTGKNDRAIEFLVSLLLTVSSAAYPQDLYLEIMNSYASALIRNGQSKEATEKTFEMLQLSEKSGDTLNMLKAYRLLGWINLELGKHEEAVRWLNKGCRLTSNPDLLRQVSDLFSNIASSYNNLGRLDSAMFFVEMALKYSRETENLTIVANSLNIRAAISAGLGNDDGAEKDLKDALKVREQIGDPLYLMSDMGQNAFFYASINRPKKGIEMALSGIALARKTNNLSKLIYIYGGLAENYRAAKDYEAYASTLKTLIGLKDSLYEKNSEDALAVMEAKYELQKKENIIIKQEYALTQNRYFTIGAVLLLLLGSLSVLLFYKNHQRIQQMKMEAALTAQKKLADEAVKVAEENERKRIAADLHDNLGSYAAAISSNVKYFREGLQGIEVTNQLEENAQSMVTQLSDTIWVLKNEHLPVTKLADRFKAWMQRLIQNYPEVKYHYTEDIAEDIDFTPAKSLHTFLILKECVNNALKHSACTDLRISFHSGSGLTIIIEDNGKGMNNNSNGGSGISNMMARAAECGWAIAWENVIPSGTRVKISDATTN